MLASKARRHRCHGAAAIPASRAIRLTKYVDAVERVVMAVKASAALLDSLREHDARVMV
jgi:hypothetical protein